MQSLADLAVSEINRVQTLPSIQLQKLFQQIKDTQIKGVGVIHEINEGTLKQYEEAAFKIGDRYLKSDIEGMSIH